MELTPQKLGLDSYDGFAAPRSRAPGGESPQYRLRLAVFYALKRYALLRFFDDGYVFFRIRRINLRIRIVQMTVVMRELIGVVTYFFVWNIRTHDAGFTVRAAAGRRCQFAGFITDSHRLFQRTAFFWLRTAGKILRTCR